MKYFFSYCYFFYCPAKTVISPFTFVGSAIEKNGYLPGDKFTAKYSANEPDLIVSVGRVYLPLDHQGFYH